MLPTRFVTFVAVTLWLSWATPSAFATPVTSAATAAAPAHSAAPRRSALPDRVRADQLYSLRARRRFAAYMRMRLLELRAAGLERAADAIERRLPIDELVPTKALGPAHPGPARGT